MSLFSNNMDFVIAEHDGREESIASTLRRAARALECWRRHSVENLESVYVLKYLPTHPNSRA